MRRVLHSCVACARMRRPFSRVTSTTPTRPEIANRHLPTCFSQCRRRMGEKTLRRHPSVAMVAIRVGTRRRHRKAPPEAGATARRSLRLSLTRSRSSLGARPPNPSRHRRRVRRRKNNATTLWAWSRPSCRPSCRPCPASPSYTGIQTGVAALVFSRGESVRSRDVVCLGVRRMPGAWLLFLRRWDGSQELRRSEPSGKTYASPR